VNNQIPIGMKAHETKRKIRYALNNLQAVKTDYPFHEMTLDELLDIESLLVRLNWLISYLQEHANEEACLKSMDLGLLYP
jgi:hypothetical protein